MADDPPLEFLKTLGSLAGFGSFAFLVWDPFLKSQPVAMLRPERFRGKGARCRTSS